MSESASPASSIHHTNGDDSSSTGVSSASISVSSAPSASSSVLVSSPSGKSLGNKGGAPSVKAALTMDEKKAKLKAKEEKLKAIREQRLAKEKSDRVELEKKEKEDRERAKKDQEGKLAKERKQFAAQMKKELEEEKKQDKAKKPGLSRPTSAALTPTAGVKVGFKIKELTGALKGLKITALTKDGPAHRGGLEVNDIIKQVNGKVVQTMKDWKTVSAGFRPSTSVPFVLLHNGSTITVIVHFAGVASVAAAATTATPASPTAATAASP